ncbi:MAG TPA: UDP-N-acetylglucosamine 1-carboxyvinyltransferase [Verrucomicrobiae bacterium]|nr:UDP-N-acetylglucosamine 1-carboxyvinyltransferase [Verrucomicrobiae bacterium]
MHTTNEKIGEFIAQIRQERGLTQAEFAARLGTSQSAINRMEKGRQNLSLETIGRLSDALNKQIIAIPPGSSVNLRIEGGHELHGRIPLKTSKNAAVALLCASLLNYGVTRFKNFPRIEEVNRIIEVLESVGVHVKWLPGNDIEIRRPEKLDLDAMDKDAARKTRSVIMLLGSLMHEYESFKIPYAGGCKLGERTVEPHLFALQEFGVDIVATQGHYNVTVNKKTPGELTMSEQSNTATNNVMMAAARTSGQTYIQAVSGDYMTQDLSYFLQKLGVKIEGTGTPFLRITGVRERIKRNITYAPTEDPIEAMLFITAAVVTNSEITVERVPYRWIALELLKLKKMGLEMTMSEPYKAGNGVIDLADITIHKHNGNLQALVDKIHPNLYPGINPDNLPYFVLVACMAKGRTLIHDWIYESRAIHYTELTKVGAQVELADPHRLYILGPTKFSRADVVTPPALRPASLLLLSMLAADGVSTLRGIYVIQRGYEELAERLNSLGARISAFHDS